MKTKIIALAAVVGFAAVSAQAGIGLGISVSLPAVVVRTPVVVVADTQPCPAPIVEVIPACPAVGYVWVPGNWVIREHRYFWAHGAWAYRPSHARFEHHHGW